MLRILLICQFIAPMQSVASIRWTKIAKYLKKDHDVHITVLTDKKDFNGDAGALNACEVDPLLKEDLRYFDEYWEAPNSWKLNLFYRLRNSLRSGGKAEPVSAPKAGGSGQSSNLAEEIRACLRAEKEKLFCGNVLSYLGRKDFDFDVVISSYGPLWTHLAAEKIKAAHPNVFWIADFRDPYARDIDPPKAYQRHKKFVAKHCSAADVVSVVLQELPVYAERTQQVVEISNGFDPEEKVLRDCPDVFRVLYTGKLYDGRQDISSVFQAIRDLTSEQKMDLQDVQIEYAGPTEDVFRAQAGRYGLEQNLLSHGNVSRQKALELQSKAALLLQAGWNTKTERVAWTGKTYEYMMAQKPMAYLMAGETPQSIPSRFIGKLGGVCYEKCRHDETYPCLKQYILEKYQEWKRTGNVSIQRDENYVARYSYKNIAQQVWELICQRQKEA